MELIEIRKYLRTMVLLAILFPVYAYLWSILVGEDSDALLYACLLYGACFLFKARLTWTISCPRCGQPFFRRGMFFLSLLECNHCGLDLFQKDKAATKR